MSNLYSHFAMSSGTNRTGFAGLLSLVSSIDEYMDKVELHSETRNDKENDESSLISTRDNNLHENTHPESPDTSSRNTTILPVRTKISMRTKYILSLVTVVVITIIVIINETS